MIRETLKTYIKSLLESKNNNKEKEDRKMSFGIFIKVPEEFASKYKHKEEDPSPPHITMLIINGNEDDKDKIIKVLRKEFSELEKFTVKFDGVSYFKDFNKSKTKLSKVVSWAKIIFEPDIRPWKGYLWVVLEKNGIDVEDRHVDFVPHSTLSYDYDKNLNFTYKGYVPEGEFIVEEVELWDGDYVESFKLKR
jgi:2'-5' RNA ligase